jgi:tight adherence protein B
MEIIIIYALVFVIGLIGFELILRLLFGSTQKSSEINHRLEKLKSSQDHKKTYGEILLKRGVDTNKPTILTGDWAMKTYVQSGIRLSVIQRYAYSLLWLLVCFAIGYLFVSHAPFMLFLFTTALFIGGLLGFVLRIRNKRTTKFIKQLPEAIDIIVRSISAGHPLNTAISLVSREMKDPIGSEFGLITDQLMYGSDLDSAMLDLYYRVGADELKLLVVTLSVQQGTGGNLREVLENLSGMIRARIIMKSKIRAITAEGRITAIIMAAFPFGLFFMINALTTTYFDALYESGYAPTVFTVLGVLMVTGMIILNRLVRFDF